MESFFSKYSCLSLSYDGNSFCTRDWDCHSNPHHVGWIICPIEHAEMMKAEVKVYNYYLNGDVWEYKITRADGSISRSCGFYGSDPKENGMLAYWKESLTKEELAQALKMTAR